MMARVIQGRVFWSLNWSNPRKETRSPHVQALCKRDKLSAFRSMRPVGYAVDMGGGKNTRERIIVHVGTYAVRYLEEHVPRYLKV
jgi:hypothetical protein